MRLEILVKFEDVFTHKTLGAMHQLIIVYCYDKDSARLSAIYNDQHNTKQLLTSDSLHEVINGDSFRDLVAGMKSIQDKKLKAQTLLSLLKKQKKKVTASKVNKSATHTQHSQEDGEIDLLQEGVDYTPSFRSGRRRTKAPFVVKKEIELPNTRIHNKDTPDSLQTTNSTGSKVDVKAGVQEKQQESSSSSSDRAGADGAGSGAGSGVGSAAGSVAEEGVGDAYFCTLVTWGGARVLLPARPRDVFHLAAPRLLRHLPPSERRALLEHQAYLDWKYCLERNQHGFCLIHLSVLQRDEPLLRRQASVLRARAGQVDVRAHGLTALQLAVAAGSEEMAAVLLRAGADPLLLTPAHRSALHLAAALPAPHVLRLLLRHVHDARPHLQVPDVSGLTPLMVACKAGRSGNVAELAAQFPDLVDDVDTTSGNTPLHITLNQILAKMDNPEAEVPKELATCLVTLVNHARSLPRNYSELTFDQAPAINQHPRLKDFLCQLQFQHKRLKDFLCQLQFQAGKWSPTEVAAHNLRALATCLQEPAATSATSPAGPGDAGSLPADTQPRYNTLQTRIINTQYKHSGGIAPTVDIRKNGDTNDVASGDVDVAKTLATPQRAKPVKVCNINVIHNTKVKISQLKRKADPVGKVLVPVVAVKKGKH